MTIKHLGNNKYLIRETILISGKKKELKFTGVFHTKGLARQKSLELKEELEKIKLSENDKLKNPVFTWRNALDEYYVKARGELDVSTLTSRKYVLEKHSLFFKDYRLEQLNYDFWEIFFQKLNSSDPQKKEIKKYISQVLKYQLVRSRITVNPLDYLRLKNDKTAKTKANTLSAMTKDEIIRLLTYFKNADMEWFKIFTVTYQLGLRSSEAQALCFEDIDWVNNHVVISRSLAKVTKSFKAPKNDTSRIVPMNDTFKKFLSNTEYFPTRIGFVLPRKKAWLGGRAAAYINIAQNILEIKNTNYHSLRASFITHLLISGMDIIRVQAMVGHNELKTTQRYIRLAGSDLKGATDAIGIDV